MTGALRYVLRRVLLLLVTMLLVSLLTYLAFELVRRPGAGAAA